MLKILPVLVLFAFFSAGCSKQQSCVNSFAGDFVHSKKNKDIMSSKEILLTSLFVATSHVPEEIKTDIEIFESGKSSLSKEARKKISDFAAEVICYEDYLITVEGHSDASEIIHGEDYKKLSAKRAEAVRKALIKSGIDKDKIESMGIGASKPAFTESTEEAKKQNRRVVIEAELW